MCRKLFKGIGNKDMKGKVYVVTHHGVIYLSPYEREFFSHIMGVYSSRESAEKAIASGDCGVTDENSAHSIKEFEVLD